MYKQVKPHEKLINSNYLRKIISWKQKKAKIKLNVSHVCA